MKPELKDAMNELMETVVLTAEYRDDPRFAGVVRHPADGPVVQLRYETRDPEPYNPLACFAEPNLRTLAFEHRGMQFRALRGRILVHYPGPLSGALADVPHTRYNCQCYLIEEAHLLHFPLGTRAVYLYETVGCPIPFALAVHPAELIRKADGQCRRIHALARDESLFDFFGLPGGGETNFVTVFGDEDRLEDPSDEYDS
jgi:hypothetical protein